MRRLPNHLRLRPRESGTSGGTSGGTSDVVSPGLSPPRLGVRTPGGRAGGRAPGAPLAEELRGQPGRALHAPCRPG